MSAGPIEQFWIDSTGAWRRFERTSFDPGAGFDLLTAPGSGVNATPLIQNSLNAHGSTYLGPGDYFCQSSLLFDTSMHLRLDDGANLWRNFSSTGATSSGFLRNRNLATRINHVTVDGVSVPTIVPGGATGVTTGGNIAATAGNGGNMMSFKCDQLLIEKLRSTYWTGGRYAMVGGDDHIWRDLIWRGNLASASGSGGLRYAGGDNFLGQRLNIWSGDDVFQFVPAGATNDPLWNIQDTTNGRYIDCTGRSQTARLCVAGLQDSNTGGNLSLGMSVGIHDCLWQNVQGYGGGSAVNIAEHSSTGPIYNMKFDNVKADQRFAGVATGVPSQGQPGEVFVQREATSSTPTMGTVHDIDFAGTEFGLAGVFIYNKRSVKDLLHITNPFGGVTVISTPHETAGNLPLDPITLT